MAITSTMIGFATNSACRKRRVNRIMSDFYARKEDIYGLLAIL